MKSWRLLLIVTFALAIIASVIFCTASAEVCPWDVDVTVVCHGNKLHYRLSDNIGTLTEQEMQQRGVYFGAKSKLLLAESLLSQGLDNLAVYNYLLPNFRTITDCVTNYDVDKVDATVKFDGTFCYKEGHDGVRADVDELFRRVLTSCGKHVSITLPTVTSKAVTVQQLKQRAVLRGQFTTYFANNPCRVNNVTLAGNKLNGAVVCDGEQFSFNTRVGQRTEKQGYTPAKVIINGKYEEGIGGGVCQVSTTLYNALLVSALSCNAVPHSIAPSYVLQGFDATVSYGATDLTFTNNTGYPLYLRCVVSANSITVQVFGTPNNYTVERRNKTLEVVPYDTVIQTERSNVTQGYSQVVVNGTNGIKCEAYLDYYLNGKLVKSVLLRTATYKKVDKVVKRVIPVEVR